MRKIRRQTMPFEPNSFLAGVQTGIRLGRLSRTRTPVPYGRMIITEWGKPVMEETFGKNISFVGEASLPITTIDYKTVPLWVARGEDVPSTDGGLTLGHYRVAETGTEIRFERDGDLNYELHVGNKVPVMWSVSYTDPEPAYLYFFRNTAYDNRKYALLLYKQGNDSTFQMPMYFSQAEFEEMFFGSAEDSQLHMITETRR